MSGQAGDEAGPGNAGAGSVEPLAYAVYRLPPGAILRALEPTQVPEHLFESGTYVRWGSGTEDGGISWDVVCPADEAGARTTLRLKAAFREGADGTRIGVEVSARNDAGSGAAAFGPVGDPMLEAICRLLVREHVDAVLTERSFDYSKFSALLSGARS